MLFERRQGATGSALPTRHVVRSRRTCCVSLVNRQLVFVDVIALGGDVTDVVGRDVTSAVGAVHLVGAADARVLGVAGEELAVVVRSFVVVERVICNTNFHLKVLTLHLNAEFFSTEFTFQVCGHAALSV